MVTALMAGVDAPVDIVEVDVNSHHGSRESLAQMDNVTMMIVLPAKMDIALVLVGTMATMAIVVFTTIMTSLRPRGAVLVNPMDAPMTIAPPAKMDTALVLIGTISTHMIVGSGTIMTSLRAFNAAYAKWHHVAAGRDIEVDGVSSLVLTQLVRAHDPHGSCCSGVGAETATPGRCAA